MKCKIQNSDLILYAEESLSAKRRDHLESHLADCSECQEFLSTLKEALTVIETDKEINENSFFYTRVIAKLDANEKHTPANAKRFIPAFAFSCILLAGILVGINMGKLYSNNTSVISNDLQEEIGYMDDITQEPIEGFFLNSNEEENE